MSLATYRDTHSKELREVLKLTVTAVKAAGRLVVAQVLTPTPAYAPEPSLALAYAPGHAAAAPVLGTGENAYPAPTPGDI